MASVMYKNVSKLFGDVVALDDVNIEVEDKEFLVLVGPSGCGKTTALRCLAGLEEVTEGEVMIDDNVVNDVAPKDRDIAMVFQSYALYPHMSVFDNMAFGLKLRKVPKDEIRSRVEDAAEILGIKNLTGSEAEGTLRRSAAAGRCWTRNRPRTESVPLRRAAFEPGRKTPCPNPRPNQQTASASANHLHLRDTRPDRGDDHGHADRSFGQRCLAANGYPSATLRLSCEPLCGWVYWLAIHELL